jgi:hypothetical protein
MSNSIKISPKHGLNPTMPICFFCGKPTGEIVLFGRIKEKRNGRAVANSDIKAPCCMVLNYEPCDTCKSTMSKGITIIEVMDSSMAPECSEIISGAVPTGKWSVITESSFKQVFESKIEPEVYQSVLSKGKLLLDKQIYESVVVTQIE